MSEKRPRHLNLYFSDEMFREIKEYAIRCGTTPENFVTECTEAIIATRRLASQEAIKNFATGPFRASGKPDVDIGKVV